MVNTFFISPDPKETAKILNRQHLNAQCRESRLIINVLKEKTKRINSPMVKMWIGHRHSLKRYHNIMQKEWAKRGYNSSFDYYEIEDEKLIWPWWVECKAVHASHKWSLMRKFPDHYKFKLSKYERAFKEHGYVWPSKLSKENTRLLKNGERIHPSEICDDFGKGVPSHYRIEKKWIRLWVKEQDVNPQTGRKLVSQKRQSVYDDYKRAAIYYGYL